jgi:hypothetical protein
MTRTRAGVGTSQDGNTDLPPPPSPTVSELFAQLLGNQRAMEEMLRIIAQSTTRGWNSRQGLEPNQYSEFKDFLDTEPPIFTEVEEPLQANEWLNTIEQKFCFLRVADHKKAKYASHQL